jgi:hypothetical protein
MRCRFRRVSACALFSCIVAARVFAGFAATETFLPAVGRVSGQGGAQFYTTVWATNLTSTPVSFTFDFLKQGQANANPASFADTLAAGQTKVYENVIESKFGIASGIGAARIVANGEILVSERIYDQPAGADVGNTQGLFFAGVPKSFSISLGQSASIQGIDQGGAENFRYNFALVETGGCSPTVDVQLFDGGGAFLGQKAYVMQPYEQLQPNVADIASSVHTTNARITATVAAGAGSILLAGAQLANESQDSSGFEMSFRDDLLGGSATAGVTSLNALTGAVSLIAGHDVTLTTVGNGIKIDATGGSGVGVTSLNGITGALTIAHGINTTVNVSGATITIDSASGSGTGLTAVAHDGTLAGSGTPAAPLGVALPASWSAGTGYVLSVTNTSGGTAPAILGTGTDGVGVVGVGTDTGTGMVGIAAGIPYGGESFSFTGVAGVGYIGVFGEAIGGGSIAGVKGTHSSGNNGVLGMATAGVEGDGSSVGEGVSGKTSAGAHAGVHGQHNDSGGNFAGVEGENVTTGGLGYLGGHEYGVAGIAPTTGSPVYAEDFVGNVVINGTVHTSSAGAIKFDDPSDPANKTITMRSSDSPR